MLGPMEQRASEAVEALRRAGAAFALVFGSRAREFLEAVRGR